jgi:hypothetical protein
MALLVDATTLVYNILKIVLAEIEPDDPRFAKSGLRR